MSQISQTVATDIVINSTSAEDALRRLTAEMRKLEYAKKGIELHTLTGDADKLKGKLEELAGAGSHAHGSLMGLRSAAHGLRMVGLASHSHELTQLAHAMRALSFAGASLPVLGGLAATIALVGTAAVLTSDNLAGKLGTALFTTKEQADATEKAIARLQHRLEETRFARSLGMGTQEEQQRARAEASARAPHERLAEQMRQGMGGLQGHAQALRMFPGNPFNPTRDALNALHQQALDRAVQQGPHAAPLIGADALMNLARQPAAPPAELQRREFEARGAVARGEARRAELQGRLPKLVRFNEITKRQAEISEKAREVQVTDEERERKKNIALLEKMHPKDALTPGAAKAMGMPEGIKNWYGGVNATDALEHLRAQQADVEKKRREARQNADEHARLEKEKQGLGLPNKVAENRDEELRVRKELEQIDQQLVKDKRAQVEAENALRQANLENLKAVQQTVQEQLKAAAAARRAAEAEMRGNASELGLMTNQEMRRTDRLLNKIASGKALSRKEIEMGRRNPLVRERLQEWGRRRAEKNPLAQKILGKLPAAERMKEAQRAEKDLGKADKELREKIVKGMADAGERMAKGFEEIVIPAMQKAIEQAMENAFRAAAHVMQQEMQKQWRQQQANNRPNAGNGGRG